MTTNAENQNPDNHPQEQDLDQEQVQPANDAGMVSDPAPEPLPLAQPLSDAAQDDPKQAPLEAQAPDPVQWEEITFPGKEFCTLSSDNEIVLKASAYTPERKLATLTLTNYESAAPALVEKFSEAKAKLDELEKEWNEAEDKLKLTGKISRIKEYLHHANALGDFAPLFAGIETKENAIQEAYDANYRVKAAIVEKADALKSSEDWRGTTEEYRKIIDEWKAAPSIEKNKSEELWQKIEEARNHFYERKRAHQEDVEKDMLQNLDLKLEICEQSEALAASEEWRKTSDKMKELFDKWKTIGRVATHEKNEELWNRFTQARNAFFDRKRQHYETIQAEQEGNYGIKLALVEKAEGLQDSTDWKAATDTHAAIMEEWKKTGRAPADESDKLWNRLQAARDKFFAAKRQSAEEYKVNLEDNLAQKTALVSRAEQIKNSSEWRETTDELNDLMNEWKKIGYAGKEQGDELWERFIGARKYFFDRKDSDRDKRKARIQGQVQSRLRQTKDFLHKLQEELRDDEERLEDFKESLSHTTGEGAKEEELRKHLQNLIQQLEKKLPNRREKIKDVEAQLADLDKRGPETKQKREPNKEQQNEEEPEKE